MYCENGSKLRVDSYQPGKTSATSSQNIVLKPGETCGDYLDTTPVASPTKGFDQKDFELMNGVQEAFYKSPEKFGTMSLQHGQETDTVYVFLHGLFGEGEESLNIARKKFLEGSNVIVGTLPGHEKESFVDSENNAGLWMEYAEYLGRVARRYGKKVVFIGKSTGANLAVRAAEKGYADELILIQPLFGLSSYMKTAVRVGEWLPAKVKNSTKTNCVTESILGRNGVQIQEILNAAEQAAMVAKVQYRKIKDSIPIEIYIADKDPVVSSKATEKWAQEFAPHAHLIHHNQPRNHHYDPF